MDSIGEREFVSMAPIGFSKYELSIDGRRRTIKNGYISIGYVDRAGYWYYQARHHNIGPYIFKKVFM